jgi:hypothetical protein
MDGKRRSLLIGLVAVSAAKANPARSDVNLSLQVELSSDRDQTGALTLKDSSGTTLAGPFSVFGRSDTGIAAAHGNAGRDPLQPYGDTPTGTFNIPRGIATGTGQYSNHSYGPNGALVLVPSGGQALDAAANGRTGLLIHGGDPGATGNLRATHGCLRLSNDDVARLFAAILAAGDNPRFNRCEIVRLDASIGPPGDFEAGEDAGDPPPGIGDLLENGPLRLP